MFDAWIELSIGFEYIPSRKQCATTSSDLPKVFLILQVAEKGLILIDFQIQGNVQSNNSMTDSELRKAFPNH